MGELTATLLCFMLCSCAYPGDGPEAAADTVVLLHGLGRTERSMKRLEKALSENGYRVHNIGYPSMALPIEELSAHLNEELEACCRERGRRVHFVTHSLGGILLRYYLAERSFANLGRVVMLSPPNEGSELVDLLEKVPLLGDKVGPTRLELGTDPESLPSRLGPVDFELGIITGNRGLIPIFSWLIPGPDDGKVAVERTKVSGMKDFLVVPHSHPFIMNSREVIDQTLIFLKDGKFDHAAVDAKPPEER